MQSHQPYWFQRGVGRSTAFKGECRSVQNHDIESRDTLRRTAACFRWSVPVAVRPQRIAILESVRLSLVLIQVRHVEWPP